MFENAGYIGWNGRGHLWDGACASKKCETVWQMGSSGTAVVASSSSMDVVDADTVLDWLRPRDPDVASMLAAALDGRVDDLRAARFVDIGCGDSSSSFSS
jgi:hypothetical protein